MKLPIVLALALLLIGAGAGMAAQDADSSQGCIAAAGEPVRLGAVFLADSLLSAGAGDAYRGVTAMTAALNACGGVNGRPLEWVYISAADRSAALAAVEMLTGAVPLVVGSGALAVSAVLVEAAGKGAFVYWEVTEPLDRSNAWSFSPRPNSRQIGAAAGDFVNAQASAVLEGEPARVALVSERRAAPTAARVIEALAASPVIQIEYENALADVYGLAVRMREARINTLVSLTFGADSDRLWRAMREADANVKLWLQTGEENARANTCSRLGNTDGLVTIGASGMPHADYRAERLGAINTRYQRAYRDTFRRLPSERADLAASGVYLLQRALARAEAFTPEGLRAALLALDLPPESGLLGEGLRLDADTGLNQAAAVLIHQRQAGRFCLLLPEAGAACDLPLQPFPTWRERAIREEQTTCRD